MSSVRFLACVVFGCFFGSRLCFCVVFGGVWDWCLVGCFCFLLGRWTVRLATQHLFERILYNARGSKEDAFWVVLVIIDVTFVFV